MPRSPCYNAANINMKGKKYKTLSCNCCEMIDFRDKVRKKEDRKEMREVSK